MRVNQLPRPVRLRNCRWARRGLKVGYRLTRWSPHVSKACTGDRRRNNPCLQHTRWFP